MRNCMPRCYGKNWSKMVVPFNRLISPSMGTKVGKSEDEDVCEQKAEIGESI